MKNIVGPWGSTLGDADYACALAALGVLESRWREPDRLRANLPETISLLEAEFVSGERTPVWRGGFALEPGTDQQAWSTTWYADAALLASAWRGYLSRVRHWRQVPRLALRLDARRRTDLFSFDSLYNWLSHADVGLNALVLADSGAEPRPETVWHWPLRVGFLSGPQALDIRTAWKAAADAHGWMHELADCFVVGAGRDACDVLLLTTPQVESMVREPSTRIRANLVVCLEDEPGDFGIAGERYASIRNRVHAAGAAAIGGLSSAELSAWFEPFVREASHDVPAHALVYYARRRALHRLPCVVGEPLALDRCRILAIAARKDRRLNWARLLEMSFGPGLDAAEGSAQTQGDDGGSAEGLVFEHATGAFDNESAEISIGDASAEPSTSAEPATWRLADEVRRREFTSETEDGRQALTDFERRDDEIDRERTPRWIHANAWRRDDPVSNALSLAANEWNLLGIHIGPSLNRRLDASFLDSDLDFSSGEVTLTVQVELVGASLAALEPKDLAGVLQPGERFLCPSDMRDINQDVAEQLLLGPLATRTPPTARSSATPVVGLASTNLVLPEAGDSSLALFPVWLHDPKQRVAGRILIIHANRILQTAQIDLAPGPSADEGDGVTVAAEASLHSSEEDLGERRAYDATVLVDDIGGKLHLAIQRDGRSYGVQLDALAQPIKQICQALTGLAFAMDYSQPMLQQPAFIDTLYTMAFHGTELRQHLWETCGKDDINAWQRVHLVPATNQFLPLEYVYDGLAPQPDAGVCPNILSALERGGCEHAVNTPAGPGLCPHHRDEDYVCPMHFWGFRRVIERSARVNGETAGSRGSAKWPIPAKRPYGSVKAILFAAADRAFAYATDPTQVQQEKSQLDTSLRLLSQALSTAPDWDQWRLEAKKSPNLLVLIAHTEQYRNGPVLEIGDQKRLARPQIGADVSGAGVTPQLLILLGCSAAQVTEDFQPYPERFTAAGVRIILAPIAPIRGSDAIPIAKHLAKLMAQRFAQPDPTAFGDLLPLLRRELLRDGHPGVMSIVGFGDGDWLMGGT